MGGHAGAQVLRLASNLLMTRLLVPEMFGVMTIAYVFMTGLAMFSDVGIVQNVVQSRRGADLVFLRTAWTMQILRGFMICLITLLIALLINFAAESGMLPKGSVYADSALPPVLMAISLTAFIAGFESMRLPLARRNLELSRVARIEVVCPAISLLVMVLWASFDRSIWALVAGGLTGSIIRTVLSHVVLPGRSDRVAWDHAALAEIFAFGKWVFISSALGFLVINGDRLILAGLIDAEALGLYSIAVTLVGALEAVLTKLIGNVALPALSEVTRKRPEELRAVYYRVHFPLGVAALFLVGALLTSGSAIVTVLYDNRYANAGWMLGIIAVGLVSIPSRIAVQCFIARGESHVLSVQTMIWLPTLYILTPFAFHYFGLVGAMWSIVLSALTCIPIMLFFQARAGLLDIRKELLILPAIPIGMFAGEIASWTLGRLVG